MKQDKLFAQLQAAKARRNLKEIQNEKQKHYNKGLDGDNEKVESRGL